MIMFDILKLRLEAPMADKKKDLTKGGVVELTEEDLEGAQGGGTLRTDNTTGDSIAITNAETTTITQTTVTNSN